MGWHDLKYKVPTQDLPLGPQANVPGRPPSTPPSQGRTGLLAKTLCTEKSSRSFQSKPPSGN